VDVLVYHGIIKKPRTHTKKNEEFEQILEKITKIKGLNLAKFDLFLWFIETG
jgi:thermostable 8-oxoguanine DNA glycosylase